MINCSLQPWTVHTSQHFRKSTFPEMCLSVVPSSQTLLLGFFNVSFCSCQPHLYLFSKQTVVFGKAAPAPPPSMAERLIISHSSVRRNDFSQSTPVASKRRKSPPRRLPHARLPLEPKRVRPKSTDATGNSFSPQTE